MDKMHFLVLAGGFGTRLRSVVSEVPKPLAPVGGRPFLHYLIKRWVEQGVSRFTFLLHHEARLVEAFLDGEKNEEWLIGCEIQTLVEPEPLGTGGAIAYAVQNIDLRGSFLVSNADTWLGSGIKQIVDTTVPSMAVIKVENAKRFGCVEIRKNKAVEFNEKKTGTRAAWVNAGLYYLHTDLFKNWDGQPFSLERSLLPKLALTKQLNTAALETEFIDIGVPEDYLRFNHWIESGMGADL